MKFSNKKRTSIVRLSFNLIAGFLFLVVLFFVWKEMNRMALIFGVILGTYMFGVHLFNFNYFYYSSDGKDLLIRYYPVISLFGKEYSSIEFKKKFICDVKVKRNFIFYNLGLAVYTENGIAEYPGISLNGLSEKEVKRIEADLNEILRQGQYKNKF